MCGSDTLTIEVSSTSIIAPTITAIVISHLRGVRGSSAGPLSCALSVGLTLPAEEDAVIPGFFTSLRGGACPTLRRVVAAPTLTCLQQVFLQRTATFLLPEQPVDNEGGCHGSRN